MRLVERMNQLVPDRDRWLTVPAIPFNRKIGQYAHQPFTTEGEALAPERYAEYLATVMPTDGDRRLLADIFKDPDWITPKKGDSMDG